MLNCGLLPYSQHKPRATCFDFPDYHVPFYKSCFHAAGYSYLFKFYLLAMDEGIFVLCKSADVFTIHDTKTVRII